MIDTHAHLDDPQFDADREAVICRARAVGVRAIVCVGTTLGASRKAVELAQTYPDVYAAVGIHPNSAAEAQPGDWDGIVALLDEPRVVAIGETGLDRYRDYTPIEVQREWLRRHLDLARQRGLPVILHCREAWPDLWPILGEYAAGGPLRGVLHAFGDDAAAAAEGIAMGLHVSFAGNVTYTNKKFQSLRAAAATVPQDRLLLETDSPYLVPEPHRGRQKRNEPALVIHTAAALAALRGVSVEQLAAVAADNARELFGID